MYFVLLEPIMNPETMTILHDRCTRLTLQEFEALQAEYGVDCITAVVCATKSAAQWAGEMLCTVGMEPS